MWQTVCFLVLGVAGVHGHGSHDNQEPIAGPHKSLWYNTLPGDGGTQVWYLVRRECVNHALIFAGRFRILGHLDIWSTSIPPLSSKR